MFSPEFVKLQYSYQSLYDELKLMPQRVSLCHGEEKKQLIKLFDDRCREAKEMLQGMDKELLASPSSFRSPMSTKLRLYCRELGQLQRDMKSSDLGLGFSSLSGGGRLGVYASQNAHSTQIQLQRALLVQGTASLNHATQSIKRSQCISVETDHVGRDIIEDLGEQREQLDRTRHRLVYTGENLSLSRTILRSISRRLMTNKMLLTVVIIMEAAILGAVVYLKFFRK